MNYKKDEDIVAIDAFEKMELKNTLNIKVELVNIIQCVISISMLKLGYAFYFNSNANITLWIKLITNLYTTTANQYTKVLSPIMAMPSRNLCSFSFTIILTILTTIGMNITEVNRNDMSVQRLIQSLRNLPSSFIGIMVQLIGVDVYDFKVPS